MAVTMALRDTNCEKESRGCEMKEYRTAVVVGVASGGEGWSVTVTRWLEAVVERLAAMMGWLATVIRVMTTVVGWLASSDNDGVTRDRNGVAVVVVGWPATELSY